MRKLVSLLLALLMLLSAVPAMAEDVYMIDCYWVGNGDNTAVREGVEKAIRITLKYGADKNEKIISGLKRISKPGLRIYADSENLPRVLGGLGIAVISTSQGVMTDKAARKLKIGGEVLAYIW